MKRFSRLIINVTALSLLTTLYSWGVVADYQFETCDRAATEIQNHGNVDTLVGKLTGNAQLTKDESTLSLSGSGGIEVDHHTKLDMTDDMTLSLWVNPSEKKEQALITRGNSSAAGDRKYAENGEYFLILTDNGHVKYLHNGIAESYSQQSVAINKWTHITVVRSGMQKKIKFYINGSFDSQSEYDTDAVSSYSEKLLIGTCIGCAANVQNYTGKMDEIKLYSIGLTPDEIAAIYEREKDGQHARSTCYHSPKPLVEDDSVEVFINGSILIDVLANDIDANSSDSCEINNTSLRLGEMDGAVLNEEGTALTVSGEGVWQVQNGQILFAPEENYLATPTAINYRVSDSCGVESEAASVNLIRTIVTDEEAESGNSTTIGSPAIIYGDKLFRIGHTVWYDANGNGVRESGEAGVNGVIVVLYDQNGSVVERVTTDTSGHYEFSNIESGVYSLGFTNLPTGYRFTAQYSGNDHTIDSDASTLGRTEHFTLNGDQLYIDAGLICDGEGTKVCNPNGSDNCECEKYETSSIPTMGQIALWILLWTSSLVGMVLLPKERLK